MAEYIMKSLTTDYYIESAATSLGEVGNSIYPQAKEQLVKHGISGFKDKRARQVKKTDYEEFDYLIIMDEENKYGLERIIGKDINNKVYKILDFVNDADKKGQDVDDPWYTRDFDKCFDEIKNGCEGLLQFLENDR